MKKVKTFESFLNEFGPLAGSGNTSANDLDNAKRKAAKKSERGEMVYVVSGKYGTYKLSKYHIEGETYAAFYNGMEQELDESAVTEAEKIEVGAFVRYKKNKDFTGGKIISIEGSNAEIHNWDGSTIELPLKDLEYVKSWNKSVVNEGQADVNKSYDKVIELIRKEARRLNDDDAYEFHERLKEFFNKTI